MDETLLKRRKAAYVGGLFVLHGMDSSDFIVT